MTRPNTMIIVKTSPTAALMLHIGLVNYLRISNLQKLFPLDEKKCWLSHEVRKPPSFNIDYSKITVNVTGTDV